MRPVGPSPSWSIWSPAHVCVAINRIADHNGVGWIGCRAGCLKDHAHETPPTHHCRGGAAPGRRPGPGAVGTVASLRLALRRGVLSGDADELLGQGNQAAQPATLVDQLITRTTWSDKPGLRLPH